MTGAAKYIAAIASGDIASCDQMSERIVQCANCDSRKVKRETWTALFGGPRTSWCGEPFIAEEGKSCGCLVMAEADQGAKVTITVHGREYEPAGKTVVASERCPRGKW